LILRLCRKIKRNKQAVRPSCGSAEKPFYCSGFGSKAAKPKAKEGFFHAAAGEKGLCGLSQQVKVLYDWWARPIK
jgi:hypothetical protein